MGYHAINEGGVITVYPCYDMEESVVNTTPKGKIYNGECFVCEHKTDYWPQAWCITFRNSAGECDFGYISTDNAGGNIIYSGTKVESSKVGTNYRFKLRRAVSLVNNNNVAKVYLNAGDYIYSNTGTCGQSDPENMKINAYKKDGVITYFDGFAKIKYANGSMFNSDFTLMKG